MTDTRVLIHKLGGKLSLPSLPTVVQEVQRALRDPNSGMRDIARVLMADPPLAGRVLRIANSAYYGLQVKVVDVSHAVTILGQDTLQSIVLQIATERLFANVQPCLDFKPSDLWAHSVLTAEVAGSAPASFYRGMHRAEVHSTGLLHDIGSFVMFEHIREEFAACRKEARERGLPDWEMENRRFGSHHGHVGELIARRWSLPRLAVQAIARHHDPKVAESEDTVVPWIAAANHIAHHVVQGRRGAELAEPLPDCLDERLGLTGSPWLPELLERSLELGDGHSGGRAA